MADDGSQSGGLLGIDPNLLVNLGMGLLAGSRFGSNAGEGLLQGMQSYQQQRAGNQNYQINAYNLQRQKAMNQMLQGLMQQQPDASQQPAATPAQPPATAGGTGAAPPQQAPPPSPTSSLLTPPNMSGMSVGGMNPRAAQMYSILNGKDPLQAASEVRTQQQAMAQLQVAPALAKLDTVIKSDKPSQYVAADPELADAWRSLAGHAGYDPVKDMNDQNIRTVLTMGRNQLSAAVGKDSIAPNVPLKTVPLNDGSGRMAQVDPTTGKITILEPSALEKVQGKDGQPTLVPTAKAGGMTPYNQFDMPAAAMGTPAGKMVANMQSIGATFPGARTPAAQIAMARNFLAANPNMAPEDAANAVRTGAFDANGAKRSTGQLAQMSAATDVSSKQIEKNFDSLAPLVQKNGIPKVNGWINSLEANLKPGGDAQATEAQGYLLAIAGEYAKIRGGGTGAAAPAEGEQKEALKYMSNILTQGGFDGARSAITTEAQNKRDSIREAMQSAASVGHNVGSTAGPAHPQDIQDLLTKYGH